MDPIEDSGEAVTPCASAVRRRARQKRRAADFHTLERAAEQAALRRAPPPARSKPPRRLMRRSPAPVALVLIVLMMTAAGGSNSAFLGSLAALGQMVLAGMIFARGALSGAVVRASLPLVAPMAGLLLWAMVPLLTAGGVAPDLLPQALAKLDGALALLLASAMVGLRAGRWRSFAIVLTRGTALLIVLTVTLRSIDLPPEWRTMMEDPKLHRFSATLGNPNAAGALFAMLGLVASGLAIERFALWYDLPGDKRLYDVMSAGLVALGCLAMVGVTQSRGALLLWLAGEIVLLAMAAQSCGAGPRLRRMGGGRWIVPLAGGVLLLVLLLAGETLDRLGVIDADGAGRAAAWRIYGAAAMQVPITGYGLGSFPAWNQTRLTASTAPDLWNFGAAHAAPVQVVLETGWVGLALVLAGLAAWAWRIAPTLRQEPVAMGMALAVLVALGASLGDIAMNVPAIVALAACCAGLLWGRALRL